MKRRRALLAALGGTALLGLGGCAPENKLRRVGFLREGTPPGDPPFSPPFFWPSMRALGWVQGRTLALEARFARSREELPALAAELVRSKPDLILTNGTVVTRAVKDATRTIPIVFWLSADPVENGLVESLAHPGPNITGFFYGVYDEKLVELLMSVLPRVSKVGFPVATLNPSAQRAVDAFKLRVELIPVDHPRDFERFFITARERRVDAAVFIDEAWLAPHLGGVGTLALKYRMPAVGFHRGFVEFGGLLAYGPVEGHTTRTPVQIDRILRGAKPSDMPVEQPTHFEIAVNEATAHALDIALPSSLLIRADHVIR